MNNTALCSYHSTVGWRVVSTGISKYRNIKVIRIGKLKLLRLPISLIVKSGQFCNPRKLLGLKNYNTNKEKQKENFQTTFFKNCISCIHYERDPS